MFCLKRLKLYLITIALLCVTSSYAFALGGDANQDGSVTSADITCVIFGIFGLSCAMPDCNGDESVTSADITCVILAIFGQSPAPTPTPTAGPTPTLTPTPTPTPPSMPTTHDVSMEDFFFDPKDITIKVGDTVRWTNNGNFNHTTQDDGDVVWNSNNQFPLPNGMQPGNVFQFTFTSEDVFPYFCLFHGGIGGIGMAGTVTVEP